MNIFSKKFWHHVGDGLTKNPITDFFSDYAKESGLQTDAENEYQKIKHSSPDAIEERAHQLGNKIQNSGDNSDLADAGTNAAVDGAIDAATDAAVDGAILEERDTGMTTWAKAKFALLGVATLLLVLAVSAALAQTIVTKDYHAGTAPTHCWIYYDSGGIEGGALDPNLLGGIGGNAEWSFPEPRISFVEFGQVGCKNSGASFLCSDETNRNPLTDPNLLPQVVQYCLTANHRLGGANRAAHATVEFDGLDGTYTQIKHVLVTSDNQMDYYRGCLPSCSSVGHTGKSIVDGKVVCDKDKDSGFTFNAAPVCQ